MDPLTSPLLTDLYEINMVQAYLDSGETKTAVFEFFVRKLPPRRGFFIAAGLHQVLDCLENLRFSPEDIAWLAQTGRFSKALLDYLSGFRFSGDVHAMAEGQIFFPNEPILRITAPMPEAQFVETRIINILHYQTLIASKAARMILAGPGRQMVDFGLRRAHGADAGLMAARAAFIAGFAGSATLLAEHDFGIPAYGTMAHSFIEAFDNENIAFESFAKACPGKLTLLIDTYDTEAAARRLVKLAPRLSAQGFHIDAVRLDSGDLIALARSVRSILNNGGLGDVAIFVSGGLDEDDVARIMEAGAPIDGFGIGTSLTTSSDAPALDCAYKLQEYAGLPRRKRSAGKATWPGRKQVWRRYDGAGRMSSDMVSLDMDLHEGEPLIDCVMKNGLRIAEPPSLTQIRERAARDLARLPEPLASLDPAGTYPVEITGLLRQAADEVDRRVAQMKETMP